MILLRDTSGGANLPRALPPGNFRASGREQGMRVLLLVDVKNARSESSISECNANGGVGDVVVYTSYVTKLTCADADLRSCIANDPLLAVSHNPCTDGLQRQLSTRVMRHMTIERSA